jgi:hypothetical protein
MNGLVNGLKHSRWKSLTHAFVAFSVIWTLVKATVYFIPSVNLSGHLPLGIVILASLIYSGYQSWQPSSVELNIKHTNTKVTILFGDLFTQDGYRAIPVNEFFDSSFGNPVSDNSLHGLFLKKCFGGYPDSFDRIVENELAGVPFDDISRSEGKSKRFPIGTTVKIEEDKQS